MNIKLTKRFADACAYMYEAHGNKYRKGTGIPYVSHLMAAAVIVLENGSSEDEVIAALLHDAPEDEGGQVRLDDIKSRFGLRVAEIVEHCSDTLEQEKPKWKPRKESYLAKLKQTDDRSVLLVSIADKTHNLRSILRDYKELGEQLWPRFNSGRDDIYWYYSEFCFVYEDKLEAVFPELVADYRAIFQELDDLIAKA